jgi:hypothetical protein
LRAGFRIDQARAETLPFLIASCIARSIRSLGSACVIGR